MRTARAPVALVAALLLLPPAAEAGWFACGGAYFACMSACTSGAAAGGLLAGVASGGVMGPSGMIYGAAACAYVCAGITGTTCAGGFFVGPLCFADGTLIRARLANGTVTELPAERVAPGVLVETLDPTGSSVVWTPVVSNWRIEGPETFSRWNVDVESEDGGSHRVALTQTARHLSIRLKAGESLPQHGGSLVEAQHVEVGDTVVAAVGGRLSQGRVAGAEAVELPYRNALTTSMGTVFANGIYSTTICEGLAGVPAHLQLNASLAMDEWRRLHRSITV